MYLLFFVSVVGDIVSLHVKKKQIIISHSEQPTLSLLSQSVAQRRPSKLHLHVIRKYVSMLLYVLGDRDLL